MTARFRILFSVSPSISQETGAIKERGSFLLSGAVNPVGIASVSIPGCSSSAWLLFPGGMGFAVRSSSGQSGLFFFMPGIIS